MTKYKKYVQKIFEEVANFYHLPQDFHLKQSTKMNNFYKKKEQILESIRKEESTNKEHKLSLINADKFEAQIVSGVPEHIWKAIREQQEIVFNNLFSIPPGAPQSYWQMRGNAEELYRRQKQYIEECDKIHKKFAPLIAAYPPKIILTKKEKENV